MAALRFVPAQPDLPQMSHIDGLGAHRDAPLCHPEPLALERSEGEAKVCPRANRRNLALRERRRRRTHGRSASPCVLALVEGGTMPPVVT